MKSVKSSFPMGPIVWAVDPYEKEVKTDPRILMSLTQGTEIYPLYVASTSTAAIQDDLRTDEEFFQSALDNKLLGAQLPNLRAGNVLYSENSGNKAAAQKLIEFALLKKARAIAVSSHGRSGLDRVAFGSFAEAVLMASPLPLVFLSDNRKDKRKATDKNIAFFPTDFSDYAERAFQAFLPIAMQSHWEIVLFHSIISPSSVAMGEGLYVPETYFLTQKRDCASKAEIWKEQALTEGVTLSYTMEENSVGYVRSAEIFASAAEVGASLVVMPSSSGLMSQAVLGSIAFDVFRAGILPVWVYGKTAMEGTMETTETRAEKPKRQENQREAR